MPALSNTNTADIMKYLLEAAIYEENGAITDEAFVLIQRAAGFQIDPEIAEVIAMYSSIPGEEPGRGTLIETYSLEIREASGCRSCFFQRRLRSHLPKSTSSESD